MKMLNRLSSILPILFLVTLAGATAHAAHPASKIADGVAMRPGVVSWSPDGRTIAYIADRLYLFDTATKEAKAIAVEGPSYISYISASELAAIHTKGGRRVLSVVDSSSSASREVETGEGPLAVFPLKTEPGRIVILSASFTRRSIGMDIRYDIASLDIDDRSSRRLHSYSKIFMTKTLDETSFTAWTHGGLCSLDNLLYMEHVKPPVMPFYTAVYSIDGVTAILRELAGRDGRGPFFSGSWSPDCRRVALTTTEGALHVYDTHRPAVLETDVQGMFPSWNPRGSQIYIGGYLVATDGSSKEELLTDEARSVGFWSPDGRRIAVAGKAGLILLDGFSPAFILPDGLPSAETIEKISTLRALFEGGLLNPEEFIKRYDGVIERTVKRR